MLIQYYNEKWPEYFEQIKGIIQKAYGKKAIQIEHIGSTAVPQLAAKPIIDIDIIYDSNEEFEEIKACLENLGYYHNGDQGIPGREAFKRRNLEPKNHILDTINHHLYVCCENSAELFRHLVFRDHLRANAESRTKYQKLKSDIAQEANQDRKEYARIKEIKAKEFINSLIEEELKMK
jgi:GrpB-like predicted nucleotidyltransferase (UPF0157 family)